MLLHLVSNCLAAEPSAPDPFIPAQATVILLAGLSGDLQSETTYQSQLQSWLELLPALPNPPAQIFVFTDAPDTYALTFPPNVPAHRFKSSRDEFLALGKSLGGQTNPLVVIAWGHGGMQGNVPVFHVPGPRLTAADFKTFAAQIPATDSRWLLFFRGSGKFAAQLSDERRFLLTSEKDTMFNSDPVGLPLVLKALHANPALTFPALANELGRATVAWYKDRNLVRTEEPTPSGMASVLPYTTSPQILAPSEADSTTNAPSANTQSAATPSANSPGQPTTTTNLPAIWKDIRWIEPQDYPDADGVVLRRRITYTLSGSNPAITSENEDFIQVLTAEGKHLGDFDFSYSPPDEDITFLNCEILLPDGKLISLDPDEIRDAADQSFGEYRAARRKIFSLPGIVPGAILRVHYQTDWKTFPMPYISLRIPIIADLPVIDAAVQVSVPKDAAFHFAFDHFTAADPAIKQTTYGSAYSWQFQNLPAHEREILSPPFHEPALLISTFPDWQTFSSWYARISEQTDAVTPAIAAKAAELTTDVKTDSERAQKLFNFVTGLRYVAVELGVNSFRPHSADEVLKHQYGDCKDKANLFNTLLHSQKIEAHLVLVPRFTQARDNLPGFAFNHAISELKLGDETIFADTTDDVCRFGMLPPGDPGRKVLVLDGKSTALTQLPLPTPNAHQLKLRAQINCATESSALPATLDATALGFADYTLRSAAMDFKGGKSLLPLLAVHFRPTAGVFGLEKQTHTSVSALNEDFTWNAEGFFAGILSTAGEKRALRAPFWLPKEWDAALNHRQTPLYLHQGYPLLLDETLEFTLPAKSQQITLPAAAENTTEPLTWKMEWSQSSATIINAHLHIELAQGELTLSETTAFQQQLRDLFTALAAEANFTLPP